MKEKQNKPPRIASWIIKRSSMEYHKHQALGDLEELYYQIQNDSGGKNADRWYWRQALRSIPFFIHSILYWLITMFKNYLKISYRNVKRQKVYSSINIIGLAVGLAAVMLILLYVQFELSYDKFHNKSDRIYRAVINYKNARKGRGYTPYPLLTALQNEFPEIVNAARMGPDPVLFGYKNNRFKEDRVFWADGTLFDMFSFPFIKGNPETALSEPNSVVITEEMARKYFGDEDPMAKNVTVKVLDGDRILFMKITGVLKKIPPNSHIKFDILISMKNGIEIYKRLEKSWGLHWVFSYILIPQNMETGKFKAQFPSLLDKYAGENTSNRFELDLQPLTAIHLDSGSIIYVYIFSAIALFILILSCLNYMNLTTVQSTRRTKEIGMRKVFGGQRQHIRNQFFSEVFLTTLTAALIAVFLAKLLLPVFNDLSGRELSFDIMRSPGLLIELFCLVLIVSLVSGSYPALLLSSYKPREILSGTIQKHIKGSTFKNILVVFQYAISVILIIGTMVIYSQLDYIKKRNLGFNKEQIIVLPVEDRMVQRRMNTIKNEFLTYAGVQDVAVSSEELPSQLNYRQNVFWEGLPDGEQIEMYIMTIDENFFELLDIEFLEGRNFSPDFITDFNNACIINEAALKEVGWDSAVDKTFGVSSRQRNGKIIGVVKDSHFKSLHSRVEPIVFFRLPRTVRQSPDNILVKVSSENLSATLGYLEETWGKFSPDQSFTYYFADENFAEQYKAEERFGKVASYASLLAIIIASLGLFGVASYMIEQRTKEIGIRKVLGATVLKINTMLFKEFFMLVAIANIIAWPVSYLLMSIWLQSFAYHVNIGAGILLLSTVFTLIIALITVSYKSVKAAGANPVEALRFE